MRTPCVRRRRMTISFSFDSSEILTPSTLSAWSAIRPVLGRGDGMADQLARGGPVEPHAALGCVHRLGHPETEVPKVMAEGDGPFPIDGGVEPGIVVGTRIGDDMGGGEGDAVEA